MQYYFAPLEGITGYLYRNIHHKHFPGDRQILFTVCCDERWRDYETQRAA